MKRVFLLFTVIFVASLFSSQVFAINNDSILSQYIKEADGTTSQDTDTGSGVKTGHIQDGAVTTSKIADGAVTDAKITGTISASKIQKPAKVAIVAQSGGNYTDPVSAMNSLATWCGTPSATNPCLLKIMPGIYDIDSNTLQMQQYVDIEGSGTNVTKIVGTYISTADNSEIRFIEIDGTIFSSNSSPKITNVVVKHIGTSGNGITILSGGSPMITNTIIECSGAWAMCVGIAAGWGSPTVILDNDTININSYGGFGVENAGGTINMRNTKITVTGQWNVYGVFNANSSGGTTTIDNSVINEYSPYQDRFATIRNDGGMVYVGSTKLNGGSVQGAVVCAGVYDQNYNFYANTCP